MQRRYWAPNLSCETMVQGTAAIWTMIDTFTNCRLQTASSSWGQVETLKLPLRLGTAQSRRHLTTTLLLKPRRKVIEGLLHCQCLIVVEDLSCTDFLSALLDSIRQLSLPMKQDGVHSVLVLPYFRVIHDLWTQYMPIKRGPRTNASRRPIHGR